MQALTFNSFSLVRGPMIPTAHAKRTFETRPTRLRSTTMSGEPQGPATSATSNALLSSPTRHSTTFSLATRHYGQKIKDVQSHLGGGFPAREIYILFIPTLFSRRAISFLILEGRFLYKIIMGCLRNIVIIFTGAFFNIIATKYMF